MKFQIVLKDPDTLYDAIDDSLASLSVDGLSEEELEAVRKERKESIRDLCSKWFEYGEYLTVEVDTEKEPCIVKEIE